MKQTAAMVLPPSHRLWKTGDSASLSHSRCCRRCHPISAEPRRRCCYWKAGFAVPLHSRIGEIRRAATSESARTIAEEETGRGTGRIEVKVEVGRTLDEDFSSSKSFQVQNEEDSELEAD